MTHSILIIDDEPDMLRLLKRTLEPELNSTAVTAHSGSMALHLMEQNSFDLVLTDIKMPGIDGIELLKRIKEKQPEQTVILMTAHGNIDMVVHAMKSGAYDFITKPFDHDALVVRLDKALERSRLLKENKRLQRDCYSGELFKDLIGKSAAMSTVYETITMVANTDITVLITGESGTGKNLVARAIHSLSNRSSGPFVNVSCPTVPENILESELFGYKKGAFTHATGNKTGLFQEAESGTIFLDEIGEISSTIQTKLLRVLQDKELKPLGHTEVIKVNTRIIASTNRNLKEEIQKGTFREDFYYRLNVLTIKMPPLRDRLNDIPLLSNHLLEKHCAKLNKPLKTISPELMTLFMAHHWEGNIRELENTIIRGILFSSSDEITPNDAGFNPYKTHQSTSPMICSDTLSYPDILKYKDAKEKALNDFNHSYIGTQLTLSNGNISRAAKQIGLERQALQQIMKRFGILADDYRN